MVRVAWRDPEHICERLTLQAVHRLAEPSLEWAQAARAAHPDGDLQESVDRARHPVREDRAPAGHGRRNSLLPGADPRLHELPVAGGSHDSPARGAVRPRSGDPPDRGRVAVAARGLSRRRCRRGRADRGRGHGHAGQAGAPPAAPIVDRVRSPAARVRRVHRPAERRVAPRSARVAARRRRGRDLRRACGRSPGSSR